MEDYSREPMINYRLSIFVGDNFSEILKIKTSTIYIVSVQKQFEPPTFEVAKPSNVTLKKIFTSRIQKNICQTHFWMVAKLINIMTMSKKQYLSVCQAVSVCSVGLKAGLA